MFATKSILTNETPKSNQPQGRRHRTSKRELIKSAFIKIWTGSFDKKYQRDPLGGAKRGSDAYSNSPKGCIIERTKTAYFPEQEEVPSTASSQSTNGSTLTLRSFCGSSVLSESIVTSKNSGSCLSYNLEISQQRTAVVSTPETVNPEASDSCCNSKTEEKLQQQLKTPESSCDNLLEETWIAKCLKDYCPVRFRRNKHLDYESSHFRSHQLSMTLRAVYDQEKRGEDRKVRFRPDRNQSKSYLGWLHFEVDADIIDSIDDFIASNRCLPSLFKGTGPAVRRHFFRRWKNVDRDKAIVYDHLNSMWREDRDFVKKLRLGREKRYEALENSRFLEELFNGPPDRCPTISFLMKRVVTKVKSLDGVAEHLPKTDGVPPERSIGNHPYFKLQKRRAKAWIKDLLLNI